MRHHRCAGGRDVVIANHAEFNRGWMHGFRAVERWPWDAGANALSDQCLYWGGARPKTIVTNHAPDPRLVEDVRIALGSPEIEILAVESGAPFVSRSILGDPALLDLLAGRLRDEGSRLLAWGMTRGLARLVGELRARGAEFGTPELPDPEFVARSALLDSKAGARRFLGRYRIPMPEGILASSIGEAAEAAAHFAKTGGGAVVKANNGSGGFSVRGYPAEKVLGRPEYVRKDLELRARLDGAWRSPLLVVERLIERVEGEGPLAATTDWLVRDDSTAAHLGTGVMTIRHRTLYAGVCAGAGALGRELRDECERVGARAASALADEGFTGWFDADMVVDGAGKAFVTEINLRRTCPAHAFEFAAARLGADWMGAGCVRTVERLDLGEAWSGADYGGIRSAFERFNSQMKGEGVCAAPAGVTNCLSRPRPELGCLVVAKDVAAAGDAVEKLAAALRRT